MPMADPTFERSVFQDCRPIGHDRLWGTWYFRINSTGQVLELDVVVMRAEAWSSRQEFLGSSWCPMDFGDLVVAVKPTC
jgi:hypothetical protein